MPGFAFSDDAVLVKALAARDPDAFAYLLDRYHSSLVQLALQYVPNRAVAEEVVQETWLFRILVNIARSHGVKEHRSIPFATNAELDEEPTVDPHRFRRFALRGRGQSKLPPQHWNEPEQRALDGETLETIHRAVERLPPEQREVLTMRDLLEWTASEVCDALEITESNQRVLLHRARSKVRAALEVHYDEERER